MAANAAERREAQTADEGAWNPGLESELPRAYLPLATVFRKESVTTSLAEAHELADYCGLPMQEVVAFRPERLIVHELLVRVTADLAVPDGSDYEDLGRNFRSIAATILNRYIDPHRDEIADAFEAMKSAAAACIAREVLRQLSPAPARRAEIEGSRRWRWLFGAAPRHEPPSSTERPEQRDCRIVSEWQQIAKTAEDRFDEACFHALSRIAAGILGCQGRLFGSRDLLCNLALTLVCNDYGSAVIGAEIEPFIHEAVVREGFRTLESHDKPIIMNIKGASASGKSTMRPLQRVLAGKLGLPWEDFALISPDIWRKFLLDYGSLGPGYKYAATLTGHELEIVDKKLDRHMANRAAHAQTPHLSIDRFRFDSFVPPSQTKEGTRLLTRFGDLVYMFFMITPPEATVERAWARGLKVGRYKAVEDLLAHNVEAYTGMPELFFTWALDQGRQVHYEFLDNSVPEGEPPRTVAFGWNGDMTVLDIARMLDIARFRKINIRARAPAEVYAGEDLAPEHNVEFLKRCARLIPVINFAEHDTGRLYARLDHGRWVWRDEAAFARALADPDARAGLLAVAAGATHGSADGSAPHLDVAVEKQHTLGGWGERAG